MSISDEDKIKTVHTEEWRVVIGYEGLYEVSSYGRVKSLGRVVHARSGQATRGFPRMANPRVLSSPPNSAGYPVVGLVDSEGVRSQMFVHHLVARAFLGPRPEGHLVRHLDDVRDNNLVENLAYGTFSDNAYDAVRNGRGVSSRKNCMSGRHERTPENTIYRSNGHKQCRPCENEAQRRGRTRREAFK